MSFGLGLPGAVGIFPQVCSLPASAAEPPFQALSDPATGQPYTEFFFDKGL